MTPWAVLSIWKSIKGQGTGAHSWFGISPVDICIETFQTTNIYCKRMGLILVEKSLCPI
jgi:hypothetical protein